jgi:hypothetical protein
MMMRIATLLTATTLTLAGTMALAQSVAYDYDRTTNFARLRTYAWVRGTGVEDDLNHKRIVNAIDAQLALRGLREVPLGAEPDVLVSYHATFDTDLVVTGHSSGAVWGGPRFGAIRTGTVRAHEVVIGTLSVNMLDGQTRSTVWRASATKDVSAKASPEKRDQNIEKAVAKIFRHYPGQK